MQAPVVGSVPQTIEELALCLQNTLSPDRNIGKAGMTYIPFWLIHLAILSGSFACSWATALGRWSHSGTRYSSVAAGWARLREPFSASLCRRGFQEHDKTPLEDPDGRTLRVRASTRAWAVSSIFLSWLSITLFSPRSSRRRNTDGALELTWAMPLPPARRRPHHRAPPSWQTST